MITQSCFKPISVVTGMFVGMVISDTITLHGGQHYLHRVIGLLETDDVIVSFKQKIFCHSSCKVRNAAHFPFATTNKGTGEQHDRSKLALPGKTARIFRGR